MIADQLEQLYQSLMFGHDEPEMMYLTGATLKLLAEQNGHPATKDDSGQPIKDTELYCVTSRGIFLVE